MKKNTLNERQTTIWQTLHIDIPLLLGLLVLMGVGLVTIYSAGGQDMDLINRQVIRLGIALFVMFVLAQVPPMAYRRLSIYAYGAGILMLIAVLLFGDIGKGAQRWLDFWRNTEIPQHRTFIDFAAYMNDSEFFPRSNSLPNVLGRD